MRQVELVNVSPDNNNKYYKMQENSDGTFTVKYGRVGVTENVFSYPMEQWEKKYKEKIKKGYKDITSLKSTTTATAFKDVCDKSVLKLLKDLQSYSSQAIIHNYTVSSEAVTEAQVDKAQEILDELASLISKRTMDNSEVDKRLIDLYTTIPRRMKNTKDFILNGDGDRNKAKEILQREQDSIDTMRGQVSINTSASTKPNSTLEDVLGVKILKVDDDALITKIIGMMGDEKNRFKTVYDITKYGTQEAFERQKKESAKHWSKLLWHGSRNENWLNILKTGMKIRPSCAVQTGAMFGHGIYFADKARKSIGYTSLSGSYWANGNDSKGYIALYDVNTGLELRVDKHESEHYNMNYKKLRTKGEYDSLFAKGGIDLRNNEFIIYKESQCTIKYLVELK